MGKLPFESERKLIAKSRSSTNPEFGKRPEERTVEEHISYGTINLDKPSGPTSHEVVAWLKRLLGIKKIGHGGTLDPKVTGVLPVAIQNSTKILQTLLLAGKEYVCIMKLHGDVSGVGIKKVFKEFEGEIIQLPPVKSAVKRQLRPKRIYYIDILEIEGRDVLFKIGCQAGTYIRKLCHDLGEALGCGAHMLELRRTKSGSFDESNIVKMQDVIDAFHFWKENGIEKVIREVICPVEVAVEHLPKIVLRDNAVDSVCHGAGLAVPGISKLDADLKKGATVAMFTLKDELVAIGEAQMSTSDILTNDSGIAVYSKRVVMPPGTYPRLWKTQSAG